MTKREKIKKIVSAVYFGIPPEGEDRLETIDEYVNQIMEIYEHRK